MVELRIKLLISTILAMKSWQYSEFLLLVSMFLFGSSCFIRAVSKLKCTLGLPAASPAVPVLLQFVLFHSQELCALPLEYGKKKPKKICVSSWYTTRKGLGKHLDPGAGHCVGSFSLNVALPEKEELNSILHVKGLLSKTNSSGDLRCPLW